MYNLKTVGIVAEYNPLHRGHLYHIRKSRNCTEICSIIAVISSNFVQRGEPAMIDKEVRTRMALASGVNLVLELPVVYSSHNAGLFAGAAVDILAATGIVTHLSFGMETPDDRLSAIADILNDEPQTFKIALKNHMKSGSSFVQARSLVLDELIPGSLELLKQPNNNLALAYIKRIREKEHPLKPLVIKRSGAGYHDRHADSAEDTFASATAIRALFESGRHDEAYSLMPEETSPLLREAYTTGHTATDRQKTWHAIKLSLLRSTTESLKETAEMREGLENRMLRRAYVSTSLDDFIDSCTSRRYTKGRVQRYCTHLLLNLTHGMSRSFQEQGPAYIRVLGADSEGRRLLGMMRKSAALPVISKASAPWSEYSSEMMEFEHRASEIWEMLTDNPRTKREARFVPVML